MRSSDSPGWDAPTSPEQGKAEVSHIALENLFEFSPDAIFVTDAEGIIRDANPRAGELFGYAPGEFAGMNVEALVPERFRGRHPSHRENYNAHPRARQMGAAMNLFGLRKDGTEFPVDIMLKPMQTADGLVTLSFVRDATEQKAAMEMAQRQRPAAAVDCGERARLRDLSARLRRLHHDLEPGSGTHQGVHGGGNHRKAFLGVLY